MDIVVHRVNTIQELKTVDPKYGVEIDIRANGNKLILNHEPFKGGEYFEDYLEHYRNEILVLNIKEAGIEEEVLRLVRQKNVKKYFLLDVEFPYIYRVSRQGEHSVAIRYSEDECIETVMKYAGKVDWVWIDTNTLLPLDVEIVKKLSPFRSCLVCPERWGRPNDIPIYANLMERMGFWPDAVMTSNSLVAKWEEVNAKHV